MNSEDAGVAISLPKFLENLGRDSGIDTFTSL